MCIFESQVLLMYNICNKGKIKIKSTANLRVLSYQTKSKKKKGKGSQVEKKGGRTPLFFSTELKENALEQN